MSTRIVIIGGDMRSIYAAEALSEAYECELCGFDALGETQRRGLPLYGGGRADCVLLPVNRRGNTICYPFGREREISLDSLKELIAGGIVIEGSRTAETAEFCEKYGCEHFGCLEREELAIANAQLTAEGAVAAAINETDISLHRAHIMLLGFGRISKLTAHYLSAFDAVVTIAARKPADIAWARALGYKAVNFADESALQTALARSDIIMNTVPAKVLVGKRTECVRSGTPLIELASVPCTDDDKRVRVIPANGLPGKTAPVTAGRYIAEAVRNILTERGK